MHLLGYLESGFNLQSPLGLMRAYIILITGRMFSGHSYEPSDIEHRCETGRNCLRKYEVTTRAVFVQLWCEHYQHEVNTCQCITPAFPISCRDLSACLRTLI